MKKELNTKIKVQSITGKPGLFIVEVNQKTEKSFKDLLHAIAKPPRHDLIIKIDELKHNTSTQD